MSGISGKVVAITGASSGIGEACALLLAERGAKVALAARRSDRLEALAGRIRDAGGQALVRAVDVTRREDVQTFVDSAVAEFGRLDVLVSNAGVSRLGPLADCAQGVYAATKNAVRTTSISPGFVRTELIDSIDDIEAREQARARMDAIAIPPAAVARAIAFAIEQPADVEIGNITIRPTVQG